MSYCIVEVMYKTCNIYIALCVHMFEIMTLFRLYYNNCVYFFLLK